MADAAEAEQQAEALLDAVQQRDVVWIARLARGATSARFAEASCRCLSDILTDGDHVTKPVEAQHVIHALLAALRVHSASAGVQTVACRLLAAMCKESVEARTFAGDGGAVEAAVSSLRGHMENVDVLGAACLALESLARSNRENSCRAHGAGALDALLDVMRAHPRHEDLQQCGCLALGRICENGLGLFVAPDGALAAIINVLRSSPNNSAVQASALGSLAFVIPSAVNADKDPQLSSAVSCIMHALHAHVDAQAHYHACFALTRLAKYQPLKAAEALRLGTFPLLVNTLVLHKMSPIVLVSCISASRSLMFITRSAESTLAVAAVDAQAALSATLAVLRSHPENPDVQDAGCRLVSELALLSSQLAVAAAEAGAYEIMVRALRAFVTSNVDASGAACLSLASLARSLPAHRHRAHAAGAIDAVVTLVRIYPRNAAAQRDAAFALAFLCKDDPDACAHATRCGAVKPLCDAVHTHAGEFQTLKFALEALFHLVSFCTSAAAEVAAAGPAGIGVIAQLLLSSTRKQDREVLVFACGAFTHVTARQAAAAVSSADAVLPLLHVLGVCALEHPLTAAAVCHSLLLVMQSSLACAAEAAARGAAAAVDAAARAYPADAELRRHVAGIRLQLARVDAQSAAARAEAERRAAAMADALIAEEEAARAARAAPQAGAARKRPKKKRGGGGGGGAAGAENAAPAEEDAARAPEPEPAAAGAAAALSELALHDATPSAAALRRRKRAAIKAARRLAQRAGAVAGGSEPSAAGGDAESEEDDGYEGDAADAAAEAAQPAAPPPMSPPPPPPSPLPLPPHAVASASTPPAAQSTAPPLAPPPRPPPPPPQAAVAYVPLPPPPPPSPAMKECCVCLLDMPAVEQVVLTPCGHRCMCEACWREQLLPRAPAARLCPICDARVEWAGRKAGVFDA